MNLASVPFVDHTHLATFNIPSTSMVVTTAGTGAGTGIALLPGSAIKVGSTATSVATAVTTVGNVNVERGGLTAQGITSKPAISIGSTEPLFPG